MPESRSGGSRWRLGCVIALGLGALLVLWGTLGPIRGAVPVPIPDRPGFPGVEAALEPIPAPLRGVARSVVGSVQNASMRIFSSFGRETSLCARLVNWRGDPVEGATLRAEAYAYALEAKSDANGVVLLETRIIVGWVRVALVALGPDGGGWVGAVDVVPGDEIEVGELRLLPGTGVRGKVLADDGHPVPGARLILARPQASEARRQPDGEAPRWNRIGNELAADRRGRFRIPWVPVGPLQVWASDPDGDVWAASEEVTVRASGDAPAVRVVLRAEGSTIATTTGRVVDADGIPVEHAQVTLVFHGGDRSTRSDQNGRFRFTAGPPLSLSAHATRSSGSVVREGPFDGGPIELVLEPSPVLELIVQGNDGRSPPRVDARVDAWPGEGASLISVPLRYQLGLPNDGGTVPVAVLPSRYLLTVVAEGYRAMTLDRPPGKTPAPVEVVLEALPTVEGRVLRDGTPIAGAEVTLAPCVEDGRATFGGARPWRTTSGPDGTFRMHCGSGELPIWVGGNRPRWTHVWVRATDGDDLAEAGPFAAEPGVQVDLDLVRPGAVSGTLVTTDDSSPAGWEVWALRSAEGSQGTTCDADGHFWIDGLRPGTWWLRVVSRARVNARHVTVSGGGMGSAFDPTRDLKVEVRSGETSHVELPFTPPEAVHVHGRVRLDGRPVRHATISLSGGSMPQVRWGRRTALTDAAGSYDIWSSRGPGLKARWTCRSEATPVRFERELLESGASLEASLDARITELLLPEDPEKRAWRYRGETPDGWEVQASRDAGGRLWRLPVSTGEVDLVSPDGSRLRAAVELRPGAATRLVLEDLAPVSADDG